MATPTRVVMYTRAHPRWTTAAEFRWNPEEGVVLDVLDPDEGRAAQAYYDRGILSLPERRLVGVDEPEAFMRTLIDASWHARVALVDESGGSSSSGGGGGGGEIMGRAASRAGGEREALTCKADSAHLVPTLKPRGEDDTGVAGLLPACGPTSAGGSYRRTPGAPFVEAPSADQVPGRVPGREPTGGRSWGGGVGFGLGAMRDRGFEWCCPVCHYRAVAEEAAAERHAAGRRHPTNPLRRHTLTAADGSPLDRPDRRSDELSRDGVDTEADAGGLLLVGPWIGRVDR